MLVHNKKTVMWHISLWAALSLHHLALVDPTWRITRQEELSAFSTLRCGRLFRICQTSLVVSGLSRSSNVLMVQGWGPWQISVSNAFLHGSMTSMCICNRHPTSRALSFLNMFASSESLSMNLSNPYRFATLALAAISCTKADASFLNFQQGSMAIYMLVFVYYIVIVGSSTQEVDLYFPLCVCPFPMRIFLI